MNKVESVFEDFKRLLDEKAGPEEMTMAEYRELLEELSNWVEIELSTNRPKTKTF